MADLKQAFDLYDENGEGYVSVRDAASIVRVFGHNPTEMEMQDLVASVDAGSGRLSFNDVSTMVQKANSGADYASQVREAFKVFDKDGKGSISAEELKHILGNLGEKISDEELNDMFKESGLEGKGMVSQDEFIKIMLAPP